MLHKYHSWIIDTGATDHMCTNKESFMHLTPMSKPHSNYLPNGHDTLVSFVRSIQLHDSINLQGVLYVL